MNIHTDIDKDTLIKIFNTDILPMYSKIIPNFSDNDVYSVRNLHYLKDTQTNVSHIYSEISSNSDIVYQVITDGRYHVNNTETSFGNSLNISYSGNTYSLSVIVRGKSLFGNTVLIDINISGNLDNLIRDLHSDQHNI